MWWLVTLLVLALIAFFVVKMMKSNTQQQQAEHNSQHRDRLETATASADDINSTTAQKNGAGVATAAAAVAGAAVSAGAVSAAASTNVTAHGSALSSGHTLNDVREMIKILNLDGPDAGRLQIERDQLLALRKGDTKSFPEPDQLESIAIKLRQMLA